MLGKLKILFRFLFVLRELNLSYSKGALSASVRMIDSAKPITWQFTAFSSNGEDGIVDYLTQKLLNSNRRFVEIGSSNGLANNTAYLALAKKYSGIMIEGNWLNSFVSRITYRFFNRTVRCLNMFVTKENIPRLLDDPMCRSPDVFSIDIDGNDYHVFKAMLDLEFRPQIVIVEYNANYGPLKSITIPYRGNFNYAAAHPSRLYYGVSIEAWKKLLQEYGYHFLTVDSSGVNAFFLLKSAFSQGYLEQFQGVDFHDNVAEALRFNMSWEERFKLIETMEFHTV